MAERSLLTNDDVFHLQSRIQLLEEDNKQLRERLAAVSPASSPSSTTPVYSSTISEISSLPKVEQLTKSHIDRYARHLLIEDVGVEGQRKLLSTSVLVIGAGGLGASASLYLAGAGIGRIGIVDNDVVEMSNLQRQLIHNEETIGIPKAYSAKKAIEKFNSSIDCVAYYTNFTSENAKEIMNPYDIVLDATDNAATRYLINDCCVMLNKPLVSGSALRMDGQLTVYHYQGGPCYRCIFPKPPPPETVTNCSDGGVLGVVPGMVGIMQALETIKIATGIGEVMSQKLLMIDALKSSYRSFKLRGRRADCAVCGDTPSVTELMDYQLFCSAPAHDKGGAGKGGVGEGLKEANHISCKEYQQVLKDDQPHLLLDVRIPLQYAICSLPNSWNVPLRDLQTQLEEVKERLRKEDNPPVFVLCRRGIDSQTATLQLLEAGIPQARNIVGGLTRWAHEIDTEFPIY